MRMGIDACCWSNRRGFGRFTRELVGRMVAEFPQHEYTLVVDDRTAAGSAFPPGARVEVVRTRKQPTEAASAESARSPLDLWRMSRATSRLPVDVFFFPAVYSFYPLLRRIPLVVGFHDAIAETHPNLIFPGWRARTLWGVKTWLARKQAERLMTVSASAKARLAATFGYPESRIHVVTEGPSDAFRPMEDREPIGRVLARYHLPAERPLILYVGGISPHKNLQGLLRAASLLKDLACHVVIVGDHTHDRFYGCYDELLSLSRELGLEDRVSFTGFVPNEDLVVLYNAATLLVLPSFDEGFGLPVVEAMACGLPVAASRRGSLPEVLGSAGALFDPEQAGEIAAAVRRLLDDPGEREDLRREGLKRVRQFSWSAAARQAVRLLEEVGDGSRRP